MSDVRGEIKLRHAISQETRVLPVLMAAANWKLLLRWGLAGLYHYDTQKAVLLVGRRALPWLDHEPPTARRLWHKLRFPEKQMPPPPFDPCLEEKVKGSA